MDTVKDRGARIALAFAAFVILAGSGYYAWFNWAAAADGRARLATAVVQRGDLEDAVTATGTLQPRDYVDVGTQVSGLVKKLYVEIGSTVKSGQLLAEIDPTVYLTRVDANRAQLTSLQAQLSDRQSQLQLAEQQFQRQTNMMREDATTKEALQTAEAALGSAKAQIDVIRAQIQQTSSTLRGDEANLGYTKIYAPIPGTVVSQTAKQGQTLNANQQAPILVRIADLSTMTVQSQVSEADVSRLRVGMDVYFKTLGNQDKRWYGKLRQINPTPETVNNVVLYNALFDVANPDRALMTQMTAQIFFVTASATDAVLVPVAALQQSGQRRERARAAAGEARKGAAPSSDAKKGAAPSGNAKREGGRPGGARVRVVRKDGTLEERAVRVGVMTRVSAQILEGLEPGEEVVIGERTATASIPATPARSGNQFRMRPQI
ncbi:MAG: efflux RND transporter periplasmic adaptor subunit [Betaproteobacteria bacterium]|nr:efflux RND transporter periplasmic adaptor subunit [Betaproteobacteria bacterium]